MKKTTKIIVLLLAVVMIFTGCASTEYSVLINSNGTAKVTIVWDLDKEQTDNYIKTELKYSNPESYIKEMLSTDEQYYEIVTIDGKEYYEIREISGVSSKNLCEGINEALYISKNGLYITKDTVFGKVDDVNITDEIDYLYGDMKAFGYDSKAITMKLVFEFPANVVSTTGTIDKTNTKKVTFNIDLSKKSTTIFATTNKANTYKSVKSKVNELNEVKKPKIKSVNVKNLSKKKAKATIKLKKIKNAYYVIEYSTSKKFSYLKTEYKSTKKNTVVLKNLKKGKTYYVRICVLKINYAGKYHYSKYAKTTIKVKK